MNKISIESLVLEYPVFNDSSNSLRKKIISNIGGNFIKKKSNNKFQYVKSIDNISLKINQGEKIAIVGPNGAGKTSLLSVISGAIPPTSGIININGNVTSMIAQGLGIEEDATGRENIYLMALTYGKNKKKIFEKEQEIIDFSELENFIDLPFSTYSSGMKTRLNFAILTSFSPDILIIDEWLSTGDKNFQIKAENKIKNFISKNVTMVIATHSNEIAKKYCDKFFYMEKGSIVHNGEISDIDNYI
tara:strand:- start:104 stop:841 length:738 start_codon:yes stop_codon:yes gene_type:complete